MTREEAINEIKSWAIPSKKGREVLETLIPELRESEDERIRKAIITYLSNELHNIEQLTPRTNEFEAWIAYLEKQKEQKQETISISEMVSKYRNTDEYDNDGNYKGKPINCMIRAYEQGIRDTLSKVKEQKPAEWSEEDTLMLTTIIKTLELFEGRGTTGMQIDWLKSLRPQPQWKPSEEQKEAVQRAIDCLDGEYDDHPEELDSLLKDLEKLM